MKEFVRNNDNKMYTWETPTEYEWRNAVGKIAVKISQALSTMEEIMKSGNLDYTGIKKVVDDCYKKARYLTPTTMYEDAQKFLLEATKTYVKAMELLVTASGEQNVEGMFKAGRLIQEGNSFTRIVKFRIWDNIESRIQIEKEKKNIDE